MSGNLLQSAVPPPDNWPDLIPLDVPQLPRIDLAYLPGWAGDFTRALSDDTETPPELAAAMVLATCATAAARRVRVEVKETYHEPCNLWLLAALPSGNRKSAVLSAATEPLLAWECEQAKIIGPEAKRIQSERKTMEARAQELRKMAVKEKDANLAMALGQEAHALEAALPDVPDIPRLWTSDCTPEQLGNLLVEHDECMAWLSSEGGIFDTLNGRYSNSIPNLDLALKSHSGDADRVDRGSRPPVFLKNPRLTIGLSPQPDVLRGLASKPGNRGRGLLARFLYFLPPSPLGYRTLVPHPIPPAVARSYKAGVHAMLNWPPAMDEQGCESLHTLRLSEEARKAHHAFAVETEPMMRPGQKMHPYTDWWSKAAGAAIRLSGVLHGIQYAHGKPWKEPISVETMTAALEILAVITEHSMAALGVMRADPTMDAARTVWDWVVGGKHFRFTVREAFSHLRGAFNKTAQVNTALDTLEEMGYVRVTATPRPGPGRPHSPVVTVRPELVRAWS